MTSRIETYTDDDGKVQVRDVPLTAGELQAHKAKTEKADREGDAAQAVKEYRREVRALLKGYDQYEIDSWPVQLQEALDWTADDLARTEMLDAILENRTETKAELVYKILTKASAFRVAYGRILGRRQQRVTDALG